MIIRRSSKMSDALEKQLKNFQQLEYLKDVLEGQIKKSIRVALTSDDLQKKLEVHTALMNHISSCSVNRMIEAVNTQKLLKSSSPQHGDYDSDSDSDSDISSDTTYKRMSCDKHYNAKKKCDPEHCYESRSNKCQKHTKRDAICNKDCPDNKLVKQKENKKKRRLEDLQQDDEDY